MKQLLIFITLFSIYSLNVCSQCGSSDSEGNLITDTNFPLNTNLLPDSDFDLVSVFGTEVNDQLDCWINQGTADVVPTSDTPNGDQCSNQISYDANSNNQFYVCLANVQAGGEGIQADLGFNLEPGLYEFSGYVRFCNALGGSLEGAVAITASNSTASYTDIQQEGVNNVEHGGVEVLSSFLVPESNDSEWLYISATFGICRDDLDTFTIFVFDIDDLIVDWLHIDGISLMKIAEPQELSIDNETPETCPGTNNGSIEISYPNSASYMWSGALGFESEDEDLFNLTAGGYSLILIDDETGCVIEENFTISTEFPSCCDLFNPSIVLDATDQSCPGSSDGNISAVLSDEIVAWSWTGTNSFTSSDLNINGLSPGFYTLTVEDENGCEFLVNQFIGTDSDVCCNVENVGDFVINSGESVIWDTDDFRSNIIIESGASLTIENSTQQFLPGAQLTVQGGGELVVDNSTLTNVIGCEDRWSGIQVVGSMTDILIIDTEISNSVIAIDVQPDGGHGTYTNVEFIDNTTDVKIFRNWTWNDINTVEEESVFTNCNFTLSPNYIALVGDFPSKRVHLDKAQEVKFKGCSFLNQYAPFLLDEESGDFFGVYSWFGTAHISFLDENNNNCFDNQDVASKVSGFTYGMYFHNPFYEFYSEFNSIEFSCYRGLLHGRSGVPVVVDNVFNPLPNGYPETPLSIIGADLAWDLPTDVNTTNAINSPLFFGGYGLYLLDPEEMVFEGNLFDMESRPSCNGAIVHNTQGYQTIYNNVFRNCAGGIDPIYFETGLKLFGLNYSPFDGQGLQYKCNTFENNRQDIEVNAVGWPNAIEIGLGGGVSQLQGDAFLSSSNTFDSSNSEPGINEQITDFLIENPIDHKYYFYAQNPSFPVGSETNVALNVSQNLLECIPIYTSCAEDGGGTLDDLDVIFEAIQNFKEDWLDIVDGGDTESLTEEIVNSEYAEALELYYDLMSKSPNLSIDVMLKAIEKEYDLPMVLLKQILSSNPQAAKSGKIQKKLDDRLIPLPDYMRAQIDEGLNWVSYKEELEQNMATLRSNYEAEYKKIYFGILRSSSGSERLDLISDLESNYAFEMNGLKLAAELHFSGNEIGAQNALEQIINASIDSFESTVASELSNLLTIKSDLASNETEWSASASYVKEYCLYPYPLISSIAQEILIENEGERILEVTNCPQIVLNQRSSQTSGLDEVFEFVKIYPNPANDFVILELSENLSLIKPEVLVFDTQGKELYRFELNRNDMIIDLRDLSEGVYSLTLLDNEEFISRMQFIKVK